MKTIIAATDFSVTANNAVHYAADMAVSINASLLLFYSYEIPIAYGEIPVIADSDVLQRTAESEMNALKKKLLEKNGSKPDIFSEIRAGSFFHELKELCKMKKPYAVVMGSQGTTAAERFFLGGHTVHAMKHLEWPLITVPPGAVFSTVKKIAIACDFEHVVSTTPIEEIKKLVTDFKASLYVINSGRKDIYNEDEIFGTKMMSELLSPIKPEFHFVTEGNTDEAIIHFAETNNIDLLMVLPKRHGIIQKITHKSFSKQMVLHAHVPVIALQEK